MPGIEIKTYLSKKFIYSMLFNQVRQVKIIIKNNIIVKYKSN